ncbi:MAG: cell division protein FtsA [Acetobacteraceae bacterium]
MNDVPRRRTAPPEPDLLQSLSGVLPPMPPDPPPRHRPLRAGPFGVLDVGSTKISCLIGRTDSDGVVRVIGSGLQASRGVRAGGIIDLDAAEHAIRRAVAEAENMSGHQLRNGVMVNLTCGQPESRLYNVQWPVGGRPVTEHDIRRVVSEGRARAAADGRESIHVLPLTFAVDETQGVADPRGLRCEQLSARLHVIDAGTTAIQNMMSTLERCDIELADMVSAPMASGLATLVEDERQLGATVIDMGGGTTAMAVFSEGQLLHTAYLPVGGGHVTNDIARILSTPVAHAERLKTLYGNAEGSPDDEREMLPVPLVGEEEHQIHRVPRSQVVSIIRPRLEETFELVRERLEKAGLAREAGNRVVLTGGASQLSGAREMASRILDRQVRLGRPVHLRGLPEVASGPAFATAAGLLAWASGAGRCLSDIDMSEDRPQTLMQRVVNFIRDRV